MRPRGEAAERGAGTVEYLRVLIVRWAEIPCIVIGHDISTLAERFEQDGAFAQFDSGGGRPPSSGGPQGQP